ncbi:MAG: fibronectin type III domain-containing protein, partial [Bacteroidales bacterium]|nr:fibronectin type III domain-containing protein [Bacteroidales bacterium]
MKRFYKFLMPLVAIVAMALPATVQAQGDSCTIKIVGEDGYGDGWNDGSLAIVQGGTTVATFDAAGADDGGMQVGAYDSITVTVSSDSPVSFVWTSGDYDDEVTIWIYDGGGALMYTVNEPSVGTIYTMTTPCPACIAPTGLTATVTGSDVDLTWTDANNSSWEIVWGVGSFNPDTVSVNIDYASTTSYSWTGLDDGMYTAYVRADCGTDGYSSWMPVNFNIGVLIMNMATSGTDSISTCNAIIYDNGGPTGQYSTSCNATLIITPNDPTKWVTVSGTSHTEGSWDYLTIYDGIGTTGEMLWNDSISGSDATLTFGPFSSSAITVTFYSDASVVKDGFQINVSCVDAPACPRPAGLTATNVTPDSIYLSISDDINSEWVLIYGLSGFNPDTAVENVINLTDTAASIGGLLANTPYDIYVMALCPDGGYSLSRMITVRTACSYITSSSLPFTEDFESYGTGSTAFPTCWYRMGSTADRPYVFATTSYGHNNSHGLYFYASNSGGYCYAIMPPVAPDLDVNTLQVNFWARQYSTSYNCDFEVGVMTNPADASTFTAVSRVHPNGTTYEEFEVPLNSYTGTGSYVAFRAVQHPGTSTYIYLMLDDVSLGLLPACVSPSISVSNVGVHDATVSWGANSDYNEMTVFWGTGNDFANATDSTVVTGDNSYTITGLAANTNYHVWIRATCADGYSRVMGDTFTTLISCYPVTGLNVTPGPVSAMATWTQSTSDWTDLTVEYKLASDTTWTGATTTTNYFPMTGLTPATEYNFRIIATCVEGTSVAATANFRTTDFGCLVADSTSLVNDTIGNGTSTSSYFPTYSTYNYTLTQQIYLASDFTAVAGGQIEQIGIQMSAVPVARNIEIYMTNTSATNVSSAFIPIAASDLVWSGSTTGNIAAGWNNITLTTPFNYTGGNILVTFRDITGSWSSGNAGMVTSGTSGISRYIYEDGSSYSVTNPPSGGTASSNRLNMYFKGSTCLTASTCAAPIVVANATGTDAIELNWAPGASETSWMVYQRQVGDSAYTLLSTVSTTNYTATGLNPGLDYEFKVVAVCGDNDMAGFANASTECAPVAVPYTEDFQNSDYGVYSRNCWTVGSTNIGTNYPIPYVISLTGDENNKLCLIYSGGYLIMPEMNAPLNTLQARFTLVQGGDNVRLIIGLMSDPTAPIQTIMALDTLIRSDIDTSSATVTITFPFDMLPAGTTGHITFWDAFADNYNFIDNLVIEPIPTCSPVTDVTVSNVTTTGATITWTAGGNAATGYIVEYGPRNFVPGNGTTVNATTNSIALTGLNHSSDYDVYVYTVCAGTSDTSMNSNRVRFTTPCDIPTLPYTENFDNCTDPGTTRSPLPNCWNYTMLSTGTYAGASYTPAVYYTSSTGYTSSGQYCLYLYGTALTVLPEMPATVDSLYISFHHYTSSPSNYRLIIGAVDSVTVGFEASFVGIDTLVFSANENNVLRFLSTYTGTGRYIAFKNFYNNNSYDYSYHYIDDLEVGYMPSCVWPVDVHATGLTTTTAEFAWSICQASDYEYEYGPAGFTRGTGTTGTWSSTPYSISGLTLGTQYDIYVRGICGAGDTSEWSDVYTFGTLNADPATVPFYCDFTDTTLANAGWEVVNGSQNNTWYVGNAESNGSPRALYISNDNGATNSYTVSGISITYAYRDVILTGGQYALSYDWKANGESNYDYIRAWLVPASQMPTAGYLPDGTTSTYTFNSSGVAPAGWISIDGGAKLNQMTSWQTHEEELNVPAGTYHLLFMWANDGSGGTNPPAAIDNVSLALNVCPISDITLANVTGSTMQITWTGSSDSYELEYGPVGFSLGTGTTVNTTTNSATLTGLTSLTSYDIYLRAFCNVTDTSRWYRVRFVTGMCDNPGIVTSWDSTMNATTTSYSPIGYSCYNYSYVQMLIDSAQMASVGGDITAFSFLPSNSAADYGSYFTNMDVYMANVSETSLTDFIHPDATHVFHHVISNGNFNFTTDDWQIVSLDTAFTWDGHSSVLFAVNRGHGSYSCSASFAAHEGTGNKVVYDYNDNDPYNINTASGGDVSSTMCDLRLISCGGCPAPAVSVSGITYEEATINAVGSGVSYEMQYGTSLAALGNTMTSTTGTFSITGLTPATTYFFQVRQECEDSEMSSWTEGYFVTDSLPCMEVTDLTVAGTSYNSVDLTWTTNGNESAWEVKVYSTVDSVVVTVQTTSATVSGLVPQRAYSAVVRPMCGSNHNIEGPWCAPVNFTTDACQPVSNV